MTRLVRSSNGEIIHRARCHFAKTRAPWIWAEGRSDAEIRREAAYSRPCKVCKPLRGEESQ